jgi:hypothetical protein
MKSSVQIVLIVIVAFLSSRALAESSSSGNFMLPYCKKLIEGKSYGVWEGQCGGLISSLAWVGGLLATESRFCPPKDATALQSQRVVVRYLEQYPEFLHLDFRALALTALQRAWPCGK